MSKGFSLQFHNIALSSFGIEIPEDTLYVLLISFMLKNNFKWNKLIQLQSSIRSFRLIIAIENSISFVCVYFQGDVWGVGLLVWLLIKLTPSHQTEIRQSLLHNACGWYLLIESHVILKWIYNNVQGLMDVPFNLVMNTWLKQEYWHRTGVTIVETNKQFWPKIMGCGESKIKNIRWEILIWY